MPTYTLRHKKTHEERQEFMTISEMVAWEKKNPEWEVACGSPIPGYNVYSLKTDDGFKDLLRKIKSGTPGSTIKV